MNKKYNWRKWKDFQIDGAGLNESYSDDAAKKIADNFARYLLGDADTAIGGLKKLKFKIDVPVDMLGPDEHGNIYVKLYNDFYKSIKKHMKSIDF